MTPPIRPIVHTVTGLFEPEEWTLREVVEWYKKVVRATKSLGTLTKLELKQVDTSWTELTNVIARRERIPSGWLAYMCGELAKSEMQAARLAQEANEPYSTV